MQQNEKNFRRGRRRLPVDRPFLLSFYTKKRTDGNGLRDGQMDRQLDNSEKCRMKKERREQEAEEEVRGVASSKIFLLFLFFLRFSSSLSFCVRVTCAPLS